MNRIAQKNEEVNKCRNKKMTDWVKRAWRANRNRALNQLGKEVYQIREGAIMCFNHKEVTYEEASSS